VRRPWLWKESMGGAPFHHSDARPATPNVNLDERHF
jgi:hypothetical protein